MRAVDYRRALVLAGVAHGQAVGDAVAAARAAEDWCQAAGGEAPVPEPLALPAPASAPIAAPVEAAPAGGKRKAALERAKARACKPAPKAARAGRPGAISPRAARVGAVITAAGAAGIRRRAVIEATGLRETEIINDLVALKRAGLVVSRGRAKAALLFATGKAARLQQAPKADSEKARRLEPLAGAACQPGRGDPAGAAPTIAPARAASPAPMVRMTAIENAVLDALESGPAAGLDLAGLILKTSYQAGAVRTTLAALRADGTIAERAGRYTLRGIA